MRNAQQALNLHVNTLQSELDALAARIERTLASPPNADGDRAMEWDVGNLPGDVVAALLEARRDQGWEWRMEDKKPFRIVIRFSRADAPSRERNPVTVR
ncbi:MAG TPA: hypothetical protein VL283_00890 [Candidatus Baltobacteraceae bacterium]|nr:hypothetical protein [Candidatus Baltobacteraceae bacterium]